MRVLGKLLLPIMCLGFVATAWGNTEVKAEEELKAKQMASANGLAGATAAAAKSSAAIEEVKPETKKKWRATYLTEVFQAASSMNRGEFEQITYYNMLSASYSLSETERIDVRQYFNAQSTSNAGRDRTFTQEDIASQYSNTQFASVFDLPVFAAVRVYIPVGEASKKNGQHQVRLTAAVDHKLSDKLTASYLAQTRNYVYSKESRAQIGMRTLAEGSLKYKLSDRITPVATLGLDSRFYHTQRGEHRGRPGKPATDNQTNAAYYTLGFSTSLYKGVNLVTSYFQDYSLASGDDFKPFTDNRAYYNILFTASL